MDLNNHGSSSSMGSRSTAVAAAAAGHDYEVFLSFRGSDTRGGFTDHLYHSLKDAGVHVFRDNEELRKGEVIAPNLIEAIDKSEISIPIFSQDYASSKWCLAELSHMADRSRNKSSNHQVMPIFYHISPSDVRNQTETFGVSFDEHQRSFGEETVVEWKRALKEVGQLKGWHIQKGSSEAEVIEEVLNTVLRQLKKSYVALPNFVVGVEDRVEDIKSIIYADSREVKIIGIHGPGGIGKTTLATIIYNQLSNDFQGRCSFLANVRVSSNLDTDIMRLQNQLLSNILKSDACKVNSVHDGIATIKERLSTKEVLICFDDVTDRNQLKALMGDSSWFGSGSKIIITSRNIKLLREVGAYSSYEVPKMDFDQSLQLFSNLAFRRDSPPPDYMTYSTRVVELTGGLPLALEVIGSSLHGEPKDSWKSKLEKLEKVPDKDVQKSLMISYEELDDRQKQMFLDVACFFVGFDKTTVLYFWDSDLYPSEGMDVLEHMSLLKIKEDNIIWMHDQIIDFGRSITYQNGNVKLENRRRLHVNDQAVRILKKAQTEESVEAIMLSGHSFDDCRLKRKTFASVPNLKFLQVEFYYRSGEKCFSSCWRQCIVSTVLPQLRWLSLHHLDPQELSINISRCNLVILDLSRSAVTQEWDGWSQMKAAINLKVLNLSFCYHLKSTPDLSAHGKLERLILSHCTNLTQIHKSIGRLKRLVFLDLSDCRMLQQLLEEVGQLESLMELDLSYSGVRVLPGYLGNIKRLEVLKLDGCCFLREIPSEIGGLSYLTMLKIRNYHRYNYDSNMINQVPKLPESLIYLHLEFQRTYIYEPKKNEVPDLSNLVNLRELHLRLYDHREAHPSLVWWLGRLSKLETLRLTAHNILLLCAEDDDLGSLPLLKTLHLKDCYKLQSLPRLPSSLLDISIRECNAVEGPIDVSNLNQLLKFKIKWSSAISEICKLPSSLVELHLYECPSLKSIGDISNLKMLSALTIKHCAITEIRGLDSLENLHTLDLSFIDTEIRLPPFPSNLKKLKLSNCKQLLDLPRLPQKLVELHIYNCSIKMLDFSDSAELKDLIVTSCELEETRGLHCLVNLSKIKGEFYSKLEPNFLRRELVGSKSDITVTEEEERVVEEIVCNVWHPINLLKFKIVGVEISEIHGLPPSLVELYLRRCTSLTSIGDISNLKMLSAITINHCAITEIQGLDCLENLHTLRLSNINTEIRLAPFPSNLKELQLYSCNLLNLPRLPQKLVVLDIHDCPIKMLDFSDSAELKSLSLWQCPLEETRGLDCLVSLSTFNHSFYRKLELELVQGELVVSQSE